LSAIYLDSNATTAIAPEVLEEMLPFLKDSYGNPSSLHSMGRSCFGGLEQARERVASLIGAESEEIVFTSCGTEGDNAAMSSALRCAGGRRGIVTTRVEHPAVINFAKLLEREGREVRYLPVDKDGRLIWEAFMEALGDDTALVSVMYANNETGVIFPIGDIAAACRERGIPFHTDAVQAAGKVPIDVKALGVDLLTISGHKLHAPKGIGALYVRKGLPFFPSLVGGHQESGRRAGTENLASIVALGKACELASLGLEREARQVGSLRDRLEQRVSEECPGALINGGEAERLPNTASISFPRVDGSALLLRLDRIGICASAGSACSSGSSEPSHVLRSMGVPDSAIGGSIRFTLSRYTTLDEIETTAGALPGIIAELSEPSLAYPRREARPVPSEPSRVPCPERRRRP
jgi:cysteine desulfurase